MALNKAETAYAQQLVALKHNDPRAYSQTMNQIRGGNPEFYAEYLQSGYDPERQAEEAGAGNAAYWQRMAQSQAQATIDRNEERSASHNARTGTAQGQRRIATDLGIIAKRGEQFGQTWKESNGIGQVFTGINLLAGTGLLDTVIDSAKSVGGAIFGGGGGDGELPAGLPPIPGAGGTVVAGGTASGSLSTGYVSGRDDASKALAGFLDDWDKDSQQAFIADMNIIARAYPSEVSVSSNVAEAKENLKALEALYERNGGNMTAQSFFDHIKQDAQKFAQQRPELADPNFRLSSASPASTGTAVRTAAVTTSSQGTASSQIEAEYTRISAAMTPQWGKIPGLGRSFDSEPPGVTDAESQAYQKLYNKLESGLGEAELQTVRDGINETIPLADIPGDLEGRKLVEAITDRLFAAGKVQQMPESEIGNLGEQIVANVKNAGTQQHGAVEQEQPAQRQLASAEPSTDPQAIAAAAQRFEFDVLRQDNVGTVDFDPRVKQAQQLILITDPDALPQFGADGRFGAETRTAVMQKQRELGIAPANGEITPGFITALAEQVPNVSTDMALAAVSTGEINLASSPTVTSETERSV